MRTLSIVLAVAATTAGAARAQPTHALVVVSPAVVTVSTTGSPATGTATVVVRNDGAAVHDLAFSAVGVNGGEIAVVPDTPLLASNAAAAFTLTFQAIRPGLEFSGVLAVTATGASAGTAPLKLGPAKGAPGWLDVVLFGPLAGAALLVAVRWRRRPRRCGLRSRVGPVRWDLSRSWATNLTVFGALLGTILSASLSTRTYAGLNLLFGVLVVLAPLVYTAARGYVASLLVAAALTLWAALAELATVALLFHELRTARSLPETSVWLTVALVLLAGALLCVHAYRGLGDVLETEDPARPWPLL